MNLTVSILGCGWLGYPLGRELAREGYTIKGSSRSEIRLRILGDKGIDPFNIDFSPLGSGNRINEFFQTEVLIVAIPPATSVNPSYYHPNQVMNIRDFMIKSGTRACIYISSTVGYPDTNGIVTENTAVISDSPRAFAIVQAEKILMEGPVPTTVIRCGGLMGYDRNPVKYLSYLLQETVQPHEGIRKSADTPVNYVHRDDVIGIIKKILSQKAWGELFNVVAPEHPTRKEIILNKYPNSVIIKSNKLDGSFKIVESNKVNKVLDYEFKHPNPLNFPFSNLG